MILLDVMFGYDDIEFVVLLRGRITSRVVFDKANPKSPPAVTLVSEQKQIPGQTLVRKL
jgi:hypothetical protein